MEERIAVTKRVWSRLGWSLQDAKMLCDEAGWNEEKALEMAPTYNQRRAEEKATRKAEALRAADAFTNAATILAHAGDRHPAEVMADIREYVIPMLEDEADRFTTRA